MSSIDLAGANGRHELVKDLRKLSLINLHIDHSYQRVLKDSHKRIVRQWSPVLCTPLIVGQRPDGSLWVIDGQQRLAAMQALGITEWDARIIATGGPKMEAHIFQVLNSTGNTVQRLSSKEIFKAQVVAGDQVALDAVEAARLAGLELRYTSGSAGWPRLVCAAAMYRLTKTYGKEWVAHGLRVIAQAWPQNNDALREVMVVAVVNVVAANQLSAKQRERLVLKLRQAMPIALLHDAKGSSRSLHSSLYTVVIRYYNRGLIAKSRLPESRDGDTGGDIVEQQETAQV